MKVITDLNFVVKKPILIQSQHLEKVCSASTDFQLSKPESKFTNKKIKSRLWPTALWVHSRTIPRTHTAEESLSLSLWKIYPVYIYKYKDTLDFATLAINLEVSIILRRKVEDFYTFILKFQKFSPFSTGNCTGRSHCHPPHNQNNTNFRLRFIAQAQCWLLFIPMGHFVLYNVFFTHKIISRRLYV